MRDLNKASEELGRGEKGAALRALGSSADGKKLEEMIDGAALRRAVEDGDSAALKKMLSELLKTPEGKRLADNVGKIMKSG